MFENIAAEVRGQIELLNLAEDNYREAAVECEAIGEPGLAEYFYRMAQDMNRAAKTIFDNQLGTLEN